MQEENSQDLRGQRKTRVGIVASDAMDKTVVVTIERRFMHPKYKKFVKSQKRYKVHDETNECRVGDKVMIEECRPLSKTKRWKLKRILEKAPIV